MVLENPNPKPSSPFFTNPPLHISSASHNTMADPSSSFNNNDTLSYNNCGFMNDPNPTVATNNPVDSFYQFDDDFTNISQNLLHDPMAWDDNYNNSFNRTDNGTTQFQGAWTSSAHDPGRAGEDYQPEIFNESIHVPFWPPEIAPFQCSCCHVLREIIHNDAAGNCATKMEIHGRLGIICHAILEIKDRGNVVPSASQFHMIDFCRRSIDNVKQYLQQYCEDKQQAGLILVQDPLSMFYEALCVGFQWDQNVNNNQELEGQIVEVPQQEGAEVRGPKTNLAQQRERAGRMTLNDLEDYFHLPIEEAARALNLCPTVVKKICRRFGMTRWPHRKIKSYRKQISNLRTVLNSNDVEERSRAQAEIVRLEAEIASLCTGGNNQLNYIE